MSEESVPVNAQDESRVNRRAFLRKAGLAVGAAAALYVAPKVSTVKASPAYGAATGVPTPTPTPTPCPTLNVSISDVNVDYNGNDEYIVEYHVTIDSGCANVYMTDNGTGTTYGPAPIDGSPFKTAIFGFIGCGDAFNGVIKVVNCCDSSDTQEFPVTVGAEQFPCRG